MVEKPLEMTKENEPGVVEVPGVSPLKQKLEAVIQECDQEIEILTQIKTPSTAKNQPEEEIIDQLKNLKRFKYETDKAESFVKSLVKNNAFDESLIQKEISALQKFKEKFQLDLQGLSNQENRLRAAAKEITEEAIKKAATSSNPTSQS